MRISDDNRLHTRIILHKIFYIEHLPFPTDLFPSKCMYMCLYVLLRCLFKSSLLCNLCKPLRKLHISTICLDYVKEYKRLRSRLTDSTFKRILFAVLPADCSPKVEQFARIADDLGSFHLNNLLLSLICLPGEWLMDSISIAGHNSF